MKQGFAVFLRVGAGVIYGVFLPSLTELRGQEKMTQLRYVGELIGLDSRAFRWSRAAIAAFPACSFKAVPAVADPGGSSLGIIMKDLEL